MPESDKSPLRLSLELALTGKGAPAKAAYDASLKSADTALVWLRASNSGTNWIYWQS